MGKVVDSELFIEFVLFISRVTCTGEYTVQKGKSKLIWLGSPTATEHFRNKTASSVTRQFEYFAKLKMGVGEKVLERSSLDACAAICVLRSQWHKLSTRVSYYTCSRYFSQNRKGYL